MLFVFFKKKNWLQQKMDRFAYLMWQTVKKKSQNRDTDRLNIRVARFVMMRA
jgi:hypothetical protein